MITEKEIRNMPVDQTLRIIEALWEDIVRHDQDYESPSWRQEALEATERRRKERLEDLLTLETAKENLRTRQDGLTQELLRA